MARSPLHKKTVLLTGGTGSFGQAFVKKILQDPSLKKLIVFSRDEFKQHQMQQVFLDERLRFFIGDVRDKERLARAFLGADIVIHAAALKQVPTLEYNPFEAVKTNILGSQNVIDAAIDTGVKKAILISSDKAVSPVNLYGATKLCAEKIFVAANSYAPKKTIFSVVRYGNVVSSRGSIIETLQSQKATGVVSLTDKRMTRFWLTLEQGVDVVLQSLQLMRGGEIFVPKIPSMHVTDLISCVAPGCKVRVIGVRPGEKIHESLITEHEAPQTLEYENFFLIKPQFVSWNRADFGNGKPVKKDFHYASHTNKQWLQQDDLKKLIESA